MKKKYNVGIIFPYIGGVSELFLVQYVSILKSLSNKVLVVSKDRIFECNSSWVIEDKIETLVTTKNLLGKFSKALVSELKTSFNTIKILPQVDIVFLNAPVIGAIYLPQLIARIFGKKIVLITGGTQSKNIIVKNKAKVNPCIYFVSKIIIIFEKMNYSVSDLIIVFSKSEIYKKPGLKRYSQKVRCQGKRFVDNKMFRVETNLYKREMKIGFVGRFAQEKGINNFIEAIPSILDDKKDMKFLIIGDGPLLMSVQNYVKKMKLQDKVELLSWIPHDKLCSYLNNLQLLVIPSYTEGLPNVLLEAMACGTPVLATPVGAIPDIIKDGENGFIMENNSPECIKENVLKALKNPNLENIITNANALVEQEFTPEAAVKRYGKIIDSLL